MVRPFVLNGLWRFWSLVLVGLSCFWSLVLKGLRSWWTLKGGSIKACDVFGLPLVALLFFLGVWCIASWGCLFELVLGGSLALVQCNV